MTGLIGGRRTIQTGKGCWEDVKKLLFVYVPQRAPAIVLSRRADCGLAFSQRSGRRNHRLRSKFLPQDIKELRNTLAIAVRAVANFLGYRGPRGSQFFSAYREPRPRQGCWRSMKRDPMGSG